MSDPSAPIAFAAGFVSFLSPCVLPLVPGYLSYMSGIGADAPRPAYRSTLLVAAAFVAAFTAVFVALGATATLLGSFLAGNERWLGRIGGVFVIVMGLSFMGVLKLPALYREARFHPTPGAGVAGSLVLGATFAFGWTPCIGATMGTVLAMAAGQATQGGPARGALLLAVYSLGLGVPFLLSALGMARVSAALGWARQRARAINLVSGTFLVLIGVLLVTDRIFALSIWMQKPFVALNLDFWTAF